jgi:hypothetical protein
LVALPEIPIGTVEAVYDGLVAANESYDNDKIGMSEVGKECDRAIWYSFRWASKPETFTGPKLRIFKTGHIHEDQIVADLRAGGLIISEHDPDSPPNRHTGKMNQWEVRGLDGHLKGKLDGRCWNVPEATKTEHVLEIKTHNDRSWKAVVKDKVEKAKPEHFMQMQLYMHFTGLTRSLYVAENKNDSKLYTERCEYNMTVCLATLARLEFIRDAQTPPTRLHEDPEAKMAFACKYCKSLAQCHMNDWSRTNCRTCLHSTPVDGGFWHCARWDRNIPYLEQREGCGAHLFIPELVPGEQIDCDPAAESVTYQMPNGSEYVDGGRSNVAPPQIPEKNEGK